MVGVPVNHNISHNFMSTTPYQDAYNKLNEAQRQAVDQIEGPVLVIAGPGTGKTQILATRIGRILEADTTHAAPENVLCITYTNAGVVAMRKRLLGMIGPDAYRIKIETFHSFCNDIIQQNAADFGLREMSPVTEIEVIELLRKMIDKLPLSHPLKRQGGAPYYDVAHLQKLFSVMKHENWMPDYIETKVKEYIIEVESNNTNPEFYYQKSTSNSMQAMRNQNLISIYDRVWSNSLQQQIYVPCIMNN